MYMNPDLIQSVIWTTISLFALVLLFRIILVPTSVEVLRQDLFKIRRDLFLYMAEGQIEPTHPAYVSLRTTINAVLRYAEKISNANILLGFLTKKETKAYDERVAAELKQVENPEVQKRLHALRVEVYKAIGLHMFRVSPLIWLALAMAFVVLLAILLVAVLTKSVRALCARAGDRVREALDIGPEIRMSSTGELTTDTKFFTL
jgi:hypothetical protein